MSISASDYLDAGQHEIFARDLDEQIEALKALVGDAQQEGGDPDAEDAEELAALVEFRDRVETLLSKDFFDVTIVPAEEFEDHARDYALGIADVEFLDTYVDWKRFADDLRGERSYVEMAFGDDLVYVR